MDTWLICSKQSCGWVTQVIVMKGGKVECRPHKDEYIVRATKEQVEKIREILKN